MKKILFLLLAVFMMQSCAENVSDKKVNQKPVAVNQQNELLRHVVLFQFKEEAKAEDVKKVEEAFADLKNHIPEIKDFEWGTNNSPEGLNDGLTHCFFVTFADEAGREVYLPHPKHLAFVEVLKPHVEKAVVLDYWTK